MRSRLALTLLLALACQPAEPLDHSGPVAGWPHYGGDAGGTRYSPLDQITPRNVDRLEVAWTYRTGDVSDGETYPSTSAFEATPILRWETLYLSTPFSRVIALEPETGKERWTHDPGVDLTVKYSESLISRGVAAWVSDTAPEVGCGRRILFGTLDARLIALDASTGRPCPDFGDGGEVDLKMGVGEVEIGEYEVTSPPVVVGDVVVVGSAMGDNRAVELERGVIRGYDVRTGALRWSWDPIPRGPEDDGWEAWEPESARRTGAANAWAPLSVDEARDLVFVPTGSASPDMYGGERPGPNPHAGSVVALRGSTGERVWSFQTVHHDVWDFDVASQPTLFTSRRGGVEIPALVQATKMGFLFFFDRRDGEPLFPIEERPVPRSTVPGESTWPTQPYPGTARIHPETLDPEEDAWGLTPWDRRACRKKLAALRYEGLFTPPSLGDGSLQYPHFIGGANWGGVAIDPERRILVVNATRIGGWSRLVPREEFEVEREAPDAEGQYTSQRGTPYGMNRGALVSPLGIPCTRPPWGTLSAVDVDTGEKVWEVPLGTIRDLAPIPLPIGWGTPNLGGPVVTASGLVFIGAAADDYLRAFDVETGEELWKGRLPAGGQATPMTYRTSSAGRQFVVIAAGGHGGMGTTLGDHVVAFALPTE